MNKLGLSKKDFKRYVKSQSMYEGEGADYIRLKHRDRKGMRYEMTPRDYVFHWLNGKTITISGLFRTDGATCARDLVALAWHVHDWICKHPYFDDGTPISNLLASWIYRSILKWHGIPVIPWFRFVATFLLGGQEVKKQVGWV